MRVACLDSVAKPAASPTDSPSQRFLDDDDAGRHEFTVLVGRHGSHVLRYQRGALSVDDQGKPQYCRVLPRAQVMAENEQECSARSSYL